MSESESDDGLVSRHDIEELARLFDRSEFALDPLAEDCRLAEMEFEDRVRAVFREKVQPSFPGLGFTLFRSKVKSLCRVFLKKNRPAI